MFTSKSFKSQPKETPVYEDTDETTEQQVVGAAFLRIHEQFQRDPAYATKLWTQPSSVKISDILTKYEEVDEDVDVPYETAQMYDLVLPGSVLTAPLKMAIEGISPQDLAASHGLKCNGPQFQKAVEIVSALRDLPKEDARIILDTARIAINSNVLVRIDDTINQQLEAATSQRNYTLSNLSSDQVEDPSTITLSDGVRVTANQCSYGWTHADDPKRAEKDRCHHFLDTFIRVSHDGKIMKKVVTLNLKAIKLSEYIKYCNMPSLIETFTLLQKRLNGLKYDPTGSNKFLEAHYGLVPPVEKLNVLRIQFTDKLMHESSMPTFTTKNLKLLRIQRQNADACKDYRSGLYHGDISGMSTILKWRQVLENSLKVLGSFEAAAAIGHSDANRWQSELTERNITGIESELGSWISNPDPDIKCLISDVYKVTEKTSSAISSGDQAPSWDDQVEVHNLISSWFLGDEARSVIVKMHPNSNMLYGNILTYMTKRNIPQENVRIFALDDGATRPHNMERIFMFYHSADNLSKSDYDWSYEELKEMWEQMHQVFQSSAYKANLLRNFYIMTGCPWVNYADTEELGYDESPPALLKHPLGLAQRNPKDFLDVSAVGTLNAQTNVLSMDTMAEVMANQTKHLDDAKIAKEIKKDIKIKKQQQKQLGVDVSNNGKPRRNATKFTFKKK